MSLINRQSFAVQQFLNNWCWEDVVRLWKQRLYDFSVSLDPMFSDVHVFDSKNPMGRESILSWWPVSETRHLYLQLQEHLDTWPGTRGCTHPYDQYALKGQLDTLNYLWQIRESADTLCALLIVASLFSRMHSSRKQYPVKYWPSFHCAKALDDLARTQLENCTELNFYDWHYSCTEVLPTLAFDDDYAISTVEGLVRFLAEEHAALLLSIRPTRIVFSDHKNPFVGQALE